MKKVINFFLFYILIPFISSVPFLFLNIFLTETRINMIGVPLIVLLIYLIFRNQLDFKAGLYVNGVLLLVLTGIFTVMMVIAGGHIEGVIMLNFCWLIFPFTPAMFLPVLMGLPQIVFVTAFLTLFVGWLFCFIKTGHHVSRKLAAPAIALLLCLGVSTCLYSNRPSVKYSGHGFDYMNGYSSTDFTDYTVYAKHSKLVTLDHEPALIIENEDDMPVLDGAEACYPLYAAFAKAVYKDIDRIEQEALKTDYAYDNGKIVPFTNTIFAFGRLVDGGVDREKYKGSVDIFFGARPSAEQMAMAADAGVELEITPIGREAFVFFVEEDNPVSEVSSDAIRSIYHGDITNWSELGGKQQSIVAFQRPAGSGSQTMMTYFMGDTPLQEPATYEIVDAMGGVIKRVAQYANEKGAIGYTFRYFLEELNQEKGVKMLTVDGVYPTVETIEDGIYPLTVDLVMITRKDDPNANVQAMRDFILSEDGQAIIRKTGYGALR